MKNAIKAIKRCSLLTFIIIFQLAFALTLLNNVIMQISGSMDKKQIFNKLFNIKSTYLLRVKSTAALDEGILPGREKVDKEICDRIYKMKDNKNVVDVYSYLNNPLVFEDIMNNSKDKYLNLMPRTMRRFICNIVIDKEMYKRYPIEVTSGRALELKDFDKDYKTENIPILLGSDYEGKFKLGEKFTEDTAVDRDSSGRNIVEKVTFEVVGFYKDNSVITFFDKEKLFQAVNFSNSIVVIPQVRDCMDYSSESAMSDVGVFVELGNNYDIKLLETSIKEIIKEADPQNKYKLETSTVSLKEDMGNIDDNLQNNINTKLLLGSILTMLSVIGITTSILGEIRGKRREFGVRIASGASIRELCKEIVYEIMIMIGISIVLANIYLMYSSGVYQLNIKVLFANVLLVILFTILISIYPVITLRKYNVVDLLNEEAK